MHTFSNGWDSTSPVRQPQCPQIGVSGLIPQKAVSVNPKPPLRSTSLNWDAHAPGTDQHRAPILSPRDVVQVAFVLDQENGTEHPDSEDIGSVADNKRLLGQLAIQWRGALGDRGSLSTGWLTCRR